MKNLNLGDGLEVPTLEPLMTIDPQVNEMEFHFMRLTEILLHGKEDVQAEAIIPAVSIGTITTVVGHA